MLDVVGDIVLALLRLRLHPILLTCPHLTSRSQVLRWTPWPHHPLNRWPWGLLSTSPDALLHHRSCPILGSNHLTSVPSLSSKPRVLYHSSCRSWASNHWPLHGSSRSQHLRPHHLAILHRTLRPQLHRDNLLWILHSVAHRPSNLLWLHWPHDRLGSEHWTSKLLLMLDRLLLMRDCMLRLLVLARLRVLNLHLLLLWMLLLLEGTLLLLMWTWALLLHWVGAGLLSRVRAWLLHWVRTLLLRRLLGRLLLLVWTRLLLWLRMLTLLLQLVRLLTLTNKHLTHTLAPRLRLLLHQLEPLGLLAAHMR